MTGNMVRQLRERLGWSQKDLADRSGIGRSTISNIETGRYIPRLDVAASVALALGESIEYVFAVENAVTWKIKILERV